MLKHTLRMAALVGLCCTIFAATVRASSLPPGERIGVYLMTMSPGSAIYERFGHNALVLVDRSTQEAKAYNWGMFSFEEKNFVWRFIHGRLDYWMEPFDADLMVRYYRGEDRSIWLQELNLSPAQRVRLRDFLEWNAKPENKFYRYDYYRDNCSTRVRDAIDYALGGQLKAQWRNQPAGTTYRWHTRRLTADNYFWLTSLNYVMGHPIDKPLSVWEECFLPMALQRHVQSATIVNEAGQPEPLALGSARQLAQTSRPDPRAAPPNWIAQYLIAGAAFGGLLALFGTLGGRSRIAAALFALLATPWSLLTALGGTINVYGWFATDHAVARYNENLFQLNPLAWPLVVLIPLAACGVRRGSRFGVRLAFVLAVGCLLGWAIQILPRMNQPNGEIIALALPIQAGLAIGLQRLTSRRLLMVEGESVRSDKEPAATERRDVQ